MTTTLPGTRALGFLAVAAVSLWVGVVRAETSPYFIGASETLSRESNLLRLADGQAAPDGYVRSDTASTVSLLGGLDRSIGRQHVYGNLSLRDTRYSNNSLFNNFGYTGSAGLDWSTAERISGTLSVTANRGLSSFNNYGVGILTQKNLESTDGANASIAIGLVTQYSLEFTLGHRQVRNSLQNLVVLARDFDQDNASLGLRWSPRAATTLGVALRETLGRYPKYQAINGFDPSAGFIADRFKQPSIDLTAALQPSGATSFNGRLSYSKTHYDLNQQRDFSGVTGSLNWLWQPGAKLHLNTTLARDTGQNSYAVLVFNVPGSSDYSQLNNTLRVQADYDATAKIALTSAVQVTQRKIVNTIENPFIPINQQGKDLSTVLSFGARWTPLRSVLVGCDLSTEKRTASGELTTPLHDNVVSCFGQFQLQQ